MSDSRDEEDVRDPLEEAGRKLNEHIELQKRWSQVTGRQEGRVHAARRAVLIVLEARRLAVTAKQEARIRGCINFDLLEEWIAEAVTVASVDELFEGHDRSREGEGRFVGPWL
jgi:hypothetical protein